MGAIAKMKVQDGEERQHLQRRHRGDAVRRQRREVGENAGQNDTRAGRLEHVRSSRSSSRHQEERCQDHRPGVFQAKVVQMSDSGRRRVRDCIRWRRTSLLRCGVLLMQECMCAPNTNSCQAYGYMFFMRERDKKNRGRVAAVRNDIMNKSTNSRWCSRRGIATWCASQCAAKALPRVPRADRQQHLRRRRHDLGGQRFHAGSSTSGAGGRGSEHVGQEVAHAK